jgi:hypothetical protein
MDFFLVNLTSIQTFQTYNHWTQSSGKVCLSNPNLSQGIHLGKLYAAHSIPLGGLEDNLPVDLETQSVYHKDQ